MPSQDKYTDPELREQVKEELKESDKGGAPGQWSARKAQMMASEYKKRGGGYTTDKEHGQDESGRNLEKWGEEEWQTKEGDGNAKQDDGTQKRYLPKKAWEKMSEHEKQETDEKKLEEGKEGKQFVGNTEKAKESRNEVSEGDKKDKAPKGRGGRQAKKDAGKKNKDTAKEEDQGSDVDEDNDEDNYVPDADDAEDSQEEQSSGSEKHDSGYDSAQKKSDDEAQAGDKRTRSKKESSKNSTSNKKQKSNSGATHGSKHDSTEEPAQKGSADRMPKNGQRVSWKAMPGWVHGTLEKVVTSSTKVEGKSVKASEEDPRFVLKADSGKICVHKPETCFYD